MDTQAILDAVITHALTSGYFERINGHEPKSAPGKGLTAAVWADRIGPVAPASGLAATSARLVLNVRLYSPMLQEPQDAIDPTLVAAADALMAAYAGDFTLDGLVRNVDLLGAQGVPLEGQAGYLRADSTLYRVITITLPVIVNDAWSQSP